MSQRFWQGARRLGRPPLRSAVPPDVRCAAV